MRALKKPNREVLLPATVIPSVTQEDEGPSATVDISASNGDSKAVIREKASSMLNRYTLAATMAGAMPLPGADIITVSAVQTDMVIELAGLYGLHVSRDWGAQVAVMLAGGMVVSTAVRGAFSILKTLPVAGMILGGGSAAIASAATTYIIGQTLTEHFEKGGTLDSIVIPQLKKSVRGKSSRVNRWG